jgi:hypothetical protein
MIYTSVKSLMIVLWLQYKLTPNGVDVAVVKNTSLLAVDELRFLLLLLLCSILWQKNNIN